MVDFKTLINQKKYAEAGKMLDNALMKKESDELYYLRAIVSYKLKNYENAQLMLEHALSMKKEPEYLKFKAIIIMERLEFAEAFEILKELAAITKDAEMYFLSATCLMFLDDPKSKEYLQLAHAADPIKTKVLIKEFYNTFFKNNLFLSENEKKLLEERILAVK